MRIYSPSAVSVCLLHISVGSSIPLASVTQFGGLQFGQVDTSTLGIQLLPTDSPVQWLMTMTGPADNLQVEVILLVLSHSRATLELCRNQRCMFLALIASFTRSN